MKNRRPRLTALSLICSCGKHVKEPTSLFAKSRGVIDPGGVTNLYWLLDWAGMAPQDWT